MRDKGNWKRDWHGRIVREDLTGKIFNHWTVIRFDKMHLTASGNKNFKWLCKCECGKTKAVSSTSLISGRSKSCGCGLHRITYFKHGLTGKLIMRTWDGIKRRCLNPKNKDFHRYGGRGIKVCEAICNSPKAIIDTIGEKPSADHSVDRIDNDAHYSCGKCRECVDNGWTINLRWATRSQQQRNRRDNTKSLCR